MRPPHHVTFADQLLHELAARLLGHPEMIGDLPRRGPLRRDPREHEPVHGPQITEPPRHHTLVDRLHQARRRGQHRHSQRHAPELVHATILTQMDKQVDHMVKSLDHMQENPMPIIHPTDTTTHETHGATFTSYTAPSLGSTQLCVWQLPSHPTTPGQPHTITHEEVLVITTGTPTITLADTTTTLHPGDAVLVPPHTTIAHHNPTHRTRHRHRQHHHRPPGHPPRRHPLTPPWTT